MNTHGIDWSLSDAENARRLLCHPATITRKRHALGVDPVTPKKRINWKGADWKKPNRFIADSLGCSVGQVILKRKALGKPTVRVFKVDWSKVDWRKSTPELAKELKVSKSAVFARRSILAKGSGGKRGRKPLLTDKMKAQLSERKTVHEWLTPLGIPTKELNKPICLLRRLRILCERYHELTSNP